MVVFSNGINEFETIQKRQDDCIKVNVLHNQDMWASPNKKVLAKFKELREDGVLNQFDEVIPTQINALNINYFDKVMLEEAIKNKLK